MTRRPLTRPSLLLTLPAIVLGVVAISLTQADDPAPPPPPDVAAILKGHTESVYSIAFTPDGKYVVTGSFDKTLKVWETATGKEIKTFGGADAATPNLVLSVAVSPDGTLVASGSSDNTAKIWDFPTANALRDFARPTPSTPSPSAPTARSVAGAGKDGIVKVWNTADGKELFTLAGHAGPVTGVAYSANGQMLVSCGADKTLRFWNPANGQPVGRRRRPRRRRVTAVAFNPNNNARLQRRRGRHC